MLEKNVANVAKYFKVIFIQKSVYIVLKTWKMANEMKPDEWLPRYNDQNNSIFSKNKIV